MFQAARTMQDRITELEIRLALQDETIASLSDTVAKLQNALDLQQRQLRLLYQKIQQQQDGGSPYTAADEIPPHY